MRYYSVIRTRDVDTPEMFDWCDRVLGQGVVKDHTDRKHWSYSVYPVGKHYASQFAFASINKKMLFDIRWSDVTIYNSIGEYYQQNVLAPLSAEQRQWAL